jgi:hypothetical protein
MSPTRANLALECQVWRFIDVELLRYGHSPLAGYARS